jgi:hypothetical protein
VGLSFERMTSRVACALLVLGLPGCTTPFDIGLLDASGRDGQSDGTDSAIDAGPLECPEVRLVEGPRADLVEGETGPLPPQGEIFRDPSFGACVARISDAEADDFSGGVNGPERGALNADGTRAMVLTDSYAFHLYDLDLRDQIATLAIYSPSRARFHATDPGKRWLLDAPFTVVRETASGTLDRTYELESLIRAEIPDATRIDVHGRTPSADDSRWVFAVDTDGGESRAIAVVDMAADPPVLVGAREMTDTIPEKLRTVRVAMSPNGAFVVVAISFEEAGPVDLIEVYPADLSRVLFSRTQSDRIGAFDVMRASEDIDALVYTQGPDLVRVDLEDPIGEPEIVTSDLGVPRGVADRPQSFVVVSGAAYERPGWVVLSFSECELPGGELCEPGTLWAHAKVALVSLDRPARVLSLAWHRSSSGGSRHPFALPSRDLTRILFQSPWRPPRETGAELFMIELPPSIFE